MRLVEIPNMVHLSDIHAPKDLRQCTEAQLPIIATELRTFMLETLDRTGGHLAAGLGTVELALALHYVFDTPADRLVWDVGHQAYPHKILTGRQHLFSTLRSQFGIGPFPARDESPYDAFGVGHSSTSISAALGMSLAFQAQGVDQRAVAIIGDGAMTAGMAFEALNHAGALHANLLVILNDNDMSISGNVGALSNYFARIVSSKLYTSMRTGSKRVLSRMPTMWEFARRTESHIKGMVSPGTLFEELGFNYIGPVDGHDLPTLITMLRNVQRLTGPQFLHVITKKGKGFAPAEADPIKYHAVSPGYYSPPIIKPSLSSASASTTSKKSYSQIFGDWLCDTAAIEPRLVGITPAMREGSGMVQFAEKFPTQYIDVAIAEQHAVTLAAGLACEGLRPVVAIYSTFLQRAYDQLIHDVALQNLPVLFAIDRAGIVADGPTHGGSFDLSFLRCIPNMVIMTPTNEQECRDMLTTGIQYAGPTAIRYPRRTGIGMTTITQLQSIPIGCALTVRQGHTVALLVFGTLLAPALEAARQLQATVINMRFVKPLDISAILKAAATHTLLVTLEEGAIMGGAGSGVSEVLTAHRQSVEVLHLGLPDHFLSHGDPDALLSQCGLDTQGILTSIQQHLSKMQHTHTTTTTIS